jgi:hypothetical protein
MHLILTPSDETTLEKAMMLIKGGSSHRIHLQRESKLQIWQPGFHEESVRDQTDYRRKVEYIRMNPVLDQFVDRPEDWAYGTAAGRSRLDALPERLKVVTSGAKAPFLRQGGVVGAKAPTP